MIHLISLMIIGPPEAVALWRTITLTLLSRRPAFEEHTALDTEAVALEIFDTLCKILPPPSHLRQTSLDSLRKVIKLAVELSVEMRTQKPEYIMLAPLKPRYDAEGNLEDRWRFNATLMSYNPSLLRESGDIPSNEELEEKQVALQMVLFPVVIKKGDDQGLGEEEMCIYPAQVLVQRPGNGKKVVRVVSGALDMEPRESAVSFVEPEQHEEV
jgi:hypothetical protein